jgi:regulator of replication initiation timing
MKRRNLDPAKRHLERLKAKHQKCRKENAWLKEELRKREKTYDEAKWLRFDAEQEAKRRVAESQKQRDALHEMWQISELSIRQKYASEPQQNGCLGCASIHSLTRRQLSPCVEGAPVHEMELANEVHPIRIDDLSIEICTTCKGIHRKGDQNSTYENLTKSHSPTWRKITGKHPGIQGLLQMILKKD